jgi:ATP:corrinoid adenosyltransferase
MDELEQPDPNQAHRTRMARRRPPSTRKISQAKQARGVIVVATGSGEQTPAASAWQRGRSDMGWVGIVQFIKGSFSTGEETFFRRFPEVRYHVMGEGYTWGTQDRDRDIEGARGMGSVGGNAPGRRAESGVPG